MIDSTGARMNRNLLAPDGMMISLASSLRTSAKRLQQAFVAYPVRPDAHLHVADHLALSQREIGHRENDGHRDGDDLRQRPQGGHGIRTDQPLDEGQVHALTFCRAAARWSSTSPNGAPKPAGFGTRSRYARAVRRQPVVAHKGQERFTLLAE